MIDDMESPVSKENMPFVAPCRHVPAYAPWYWLSEGFQDLRKAPVQSLTYGFFMSGLLMGVTLLVWFYGSAWVLFSLLGGFVFLAPLSCIGIYAISAQLERNEPVSMQRSLRAAFKRYLGTEMVFALVLLVIFLVWARAFSIISIFWPEHANPTMSELASYLAVGGVVGAFFIVIIFSASVFALPMIMHRNVDAITAILTSINSVMHNKLAMLVWIVLILCCFLISVATAGLGFIYFLPAVGHGVWHGYLDTIDAENFPRHEVGITATARPKPDPKRFRRS